MQALRTALSRGSRAISAAHPLVAHRAGALGLVRRSGPSLATRTFAVAFHKVHLLDPAIVLEDKDEAAAAASAPVGSTDANKTDSDVYTPPPPVRPRKCILVAEPTDAFKIGTLTETQTSLTPQASETASEEQERIPPKPVPVVVSTREESESVAEWMDNLKTVISGTISTAPHRVVIISRDTPASELVKGLLSRKVVPQSEITEEVTQQLGPIHVSSIYFGARPVETTATDEVKNVQKELELLSITSHLGVGFTSQSVGSGQAVNAMLNDQAVYGRQTDIPYTTYPKMPIMVLNEILTNDVQAAEAATSEKPGSAPSQGIVLYQGVGVPEQALISAVADASTFNSMRQVGRQQAVVILISGLDREQTAACLESIGVYPKREGFVKSFLSDLAGILGLNALFSVF